MDAAIPWPAHRDATIERRENPGIPSGYTYLLQFVAHDLVHSAIPLSVTGALGADTANARRTALKLETLFGSGPVGSPFVYAQDTPNDERRTKLRLGLLGSIIVSEVIFGALEHNELPVARNARSLGEALAAISAQYYPTNVFEGVPEIAGMDQLVEFTAEIGDLRQAVPAFL